MNCAMLYRLAIIYLVFTFVGADEEELHIETLSKPDKCDQLTKKGDLLKVHYKGTLLDGTEFDSSYSRDQPFSFQLGIGQVIKGWDQGLLDMCVGEKRKLTVPPSLGYGSAEAGPKVPPHSTLIFEVELVSIEDGPDITNIFREIDSNKDFLLSREEISEYLNKQLPNVEESVLKDLPDHNKLIEDIFDNEDSNRDGYISHEEFSGPKHDEL